MKNALVIGGSGFLGISLCEHLQAKGYDVTVFDLKPPPHDSGNSFFYGTIEDYNAVEFACRDQEVVFNLAGMLGTSELLEMNAMLDAVKINILGATNVFKACTEAGVRRVFYPTKPNCCLNTYSITKKAGEEFAVAFNRFKNLDVRILRWLNAYGPYQKLFPVRKAVPVMILQALYDLDIEIWGKGEQPVDLIYTEDLAEITAHYTLLDNVDSTVRDTGNTVRMSVNRLAQLIKYLTNSNSGITHKPMRDGENEEIHIEPLPGENAADILGFKNRMTDIETGMLETIEYYKNLPNDYHSQTIKFYSQP
ncbi:MAG: NAD-dependent epimerase/dehydratase family protein [Lentisphaerae bacterium]|nr:NAD-dependent epimerase/dehydratase family protein [Lentisphaerota bacterium]MCP4100267.1 NAD-dependent epimerase/dehydratase family protein [Lentisphaerota bacterium]